MLRVASVGLGWWAHELAAAIRNKSELINIESCYSSSPQKRQEFSEKFGVDQHSDFESLLNDNNIDGLLLTTPHSTHAQQVEQAASHGKHVFVEKPFTLTAESGFRAVKTCTDAGVVLAVGHNRRFSSGVEYLIKSIESDDLGRIMHIETNFSAPSALKWTRSHWRADRKESPGGGLAGLGIHMIDLMGVFGGGVEEVSAFSERLILPVDVDDTTCAIFRVRSGATGYLGTLIASPYTATVNLYGTKGNAFLVIDSDALTIRSMDGKDRQVQLESVDTIKAELEEFALACKHGGVFRVSPEQAVHNVAVMEAIEESTREKGKPIQVKQVTGGNPWT